MSTTSIKNYSIAPYYDDFDETKNYQRVLFRPGRSVQARELTQMQTALQAQIDRHGQYAFKDGSRVVNGEASLNIAHEYLKVEGTFTHSGTSYTTANYLSEIVKGTILTGTGNSGNQVKAIVDKVVAATGSDPDTIYIKYLDSGDANRTTEKFAAGEVVSTDTSTTRYLMVGEGANVDGSNTASTIANPTGKGSSYNVREGVYFISGCFVYVPNQTIILDKYTNTPNYVVGLQVSQTIQTSAGDTTLLDNAQGVPNTAAPGADRYKISTTLIKENLDVDSQRTIDEYVPLARIENGVVQLDVTDKTTDTELTKRLATRTHEESGDYTVGLFELDVKEHLDDTTNFGYKLANDGGSANKLAIGVEPSTAYIQGFRVQKTAKEFVEVDKPRDTTDDIETEANTNTQITVGNYVKLTTSSVQGIPDLETYKTLDLKISGTARGSARARGLEIFSDHIRLYLFDIVMDSGYSFNNVTTVSQTSTSFSATLASAGTRFATGFNSGLHKLPYDVISGLANNEYKVRHILTDSVSSGSLQVSLPANSGVISDQVDIIIAPASGAVKTGVAGNITAGGNGSTSVTFNATALGITGSCKVLVTAKKNLARKNKSRVNNQTHTISASAISTGQESFDLDHADIIRIVSIAETGGATVTDRFTLDNGQRDNFYENGRIIKNQSTPAVDTGKDLVITFDYYNHGDGDYFSVDSYPTADYATIGSFNSSKGVLQLRDCIDFRPRKAESGATTGQEFSTGSGFKISRAPKPSHIFESDISYYLPRIDKLILKRDGTYEVIKGVSSENPQPPEDREDSITLYQVKLKPYVFDTNDVVPQITENKRYTMKDIAKLDKRIKNLEYYTSLSLLEQSASDAFMLDSNNNTRFKNGILVDSFRGHNVINNQHPDTLGGKCAIDKVAGTLRAKCNSKNVNMVTSATATNTAVKNSSIWTLPYSQVNHTVQPYASVAINVNPYNIFEWGGSLKLSPESDEWKETDVRPDVIIDETGAYDQFVELAEESGILGTVWNEWETNWFGTDEEIRGTIDVFDNNWWRGGRRGRGRQGGATSTVVTTTTNQSRTGIRTDVGFDIVERSAGSRVVEVNFVPFMRSRKIYFEAKQMKPNTKIYAFFDGIAVTDYVKQENFQEWSNTSDQSEVYNGVTSHPASSSGSLVTDANGQATGSFIIPRNSGLRFKTGIKEFRLSDSTTNNRSDESTFSEATFHAQGLIESVQNTIISTKVPKLIQSEVSDNRVVRESFVRETTRWEDPLAQTILIEKEGGIFVTSLDLFFKTKAVKSPAGVEVSIRTTSNGTPTQTVVPGTEVTLLPSAVNVSANGSSATNFAFDFPVYLQQDVEYAIVIKSPCDEYEAWVAEMGGFDVTNVDYRITKQPHGGSFFTSQNASTWTPDQTKDLKFTLKRAQFSSLSATVTFDNDALPAVELVGNPLTTTSGSTVVRVQHKNHGMHNNGSSVVIAGAAALNGIAANDINGTKTIANVEQDSYTITCGSSNASATGTGGGTAVTATENKHIDALHTKLENFTVPNTDLRCFLTTTSQQSIDGNETAYQAQTEFEFLPNQNVYFHSPKVVCSAANEAAGKSLKIRAVLSSTKDHLTPVIDQNRLSAVAIQNRIGDAGNNNSSYSNYIAETNGIGGSELAKYITKKIDLEEEADVIDVYLGANVPTGATVDLYWKTTGAGEDGDFDALSWNVATPSEPIVINNDRSVYDEVKYSIDPAGSFGSMAFKIVMRSSNSAAVPTIKDFRAIAAT